ncbi:hypothetical protein LCGC14_0966440, partial [marine sediment metagenome]
IGLGPENAFLMGMQCDLNLSFNIDFNKDQVYEDLRDVEIYLLDLRIEANPSSSTPTTTWSIYHNGFASPEIGVIKEVSVGEQTGILYLGGTENGQIYGQDISFLFNNDTLDYGIDANSELLSLNALSEITALKVNGIKDGDNYEFIQGIDWNMPYNPSGILYNDSVIRFLEVTLPDDSTELSVTYKLKFDFTSKSFGKITLGYSNDYNESSIKIQIPQGFLPESNKSYSAMFTRFNQSEAGLISVYTLDYGRQNAVLSDFIIYNEAELETLNADFPISKTIVNNHLEITFTQGAPNSPFDVKYGVKSQYDLSYGFQKLNKSYSDSVRLMYNDSASPKILDESNNELNSYGLNDPSLYISLDKSNDSTSIKLFNVPLLFAPEIDLTFVLDDVILDLINTFGDNFNNISIEFKYTANDGYYEFYSDPIIIPLNYSVLSTGIVDNSYSIQYNKDLQAIYDMVGADNIDIEIIISQSGVNSNYISYIILDTFDYIADEHIIENYDRTPLDREGNFLTEAAISSTHYQQIFSYPFADGTPYGDSPFELLNGSQVTIGLQDLPNSTLVSINSNGQDYEFNFLGDSSTLTVNDTNFYMIPNMGLFIDTYDIEETLYQDGFLDLYYGSGTEINGEKHYTSTILMDYESSSIGDYKSYISAQTPTSWEDTYDFANRFLTTDSITVSGRVYYHQLFDLDIDTNSSAIMNGIFPYYESNIYFGVQLPENYDIDEINSIGLPYTYALSVQGFPTGKYKTDYCNIPLGYSGSFTPSTQILEINTDYALEYDENGTAYILFFNAMGDLSTFTDANNKIMVDYWVNSEFAFGYEYDIVENPTDTYISQIKWNFGFVDDNSYRRHPDFTDETPFTVDYGALEWETFNDDYIHDGEDIFTFRPVEQYNISVLYTGETSTDIFSVQYVIPQDQYLEDFEIFPTIHTLIQIGDDDNTLKVFEVPNYESYNFISQNTPNSYNYTIDYNEIENFVQTFYPSYQLVENSYLYILTEYNSTLLSYPMSRTPFNYQYLGDTHDAYQIALYINDEFIAYSNETGFHDYISKIESKYIYFNNKSNGQGGYIAANSKIQLSYRFKLQPGLLERKHFLIVTYPYSNAFDSPYNSDSLMYRESYRKLSGGSIITPFDYSLSVENRYSLYLSYRLNERDYIQEKFTFDYASPEYDFYYIKDGVENYMSELSVDGEDAVSVYYFDEFRNMKFLDASHYTIDTANHKITLKNDNNIIVTSNPISEFYVSIIPEGRDREFASYEFSNNPVKNITESLDVTYWDVLGVNGIDVIPNLDAFYFINEEKSTPRKIVSLASQIAVYLKEGDTLEFDIKGEFENFDQDLITGINNGEYLNLYLDANIQNFESLELLTVELYDNSGIMSGFSNNITNEELEMYDFDIKIGLPSTSNTLKKIKIIPFFKTSVEYSQDNSIGISQFQVAKYDHESVSIGIDGKEYIYVELENDLKIDLDELAYIFTNRLEYLTLTDDLTYSKESDTYTLLIPTTYLDPTTSEIVKFKEGQEFLIRYNSPVKNGIALGIGELYLENKGYNYESHSDIPKAEILIVNANSTSDYSEFTSDYHYQISLQPTPFETEYNNKLKAIKIDLDLTSLYQSTGKNILDFSHLIFSVPNPCYELTINEVLIIKESSESTTLSGSSDSRIWQFSETEIFNANATPEYDSYQLTLGSSPLFYPDISWLDYINIYDEDGNYYTAGLTGNDHQLHYEPSNNTFTWNPAFNQFPEYFGMEFEEPLIISPNKTLYFEYSTNTSWTELIRIEEENIDLQSIRLIYDYNYLLKPEYYDWYAINFSPEHSYENIAYSFKEEPEYEVVQYYYEGFSVYKNVSQYTHAFDMGNHSFETDFVNLSIYKVIALTPTLETEILTDNINYTVIFDKTAKTLAITDLNSVLNRFDLISVILNYSYGPVSSYTEISLLDGFNQTYLDDPKETFYNNVDIDYRYRAESGTALFAESSTTLTSQSTTFESIDYSRNPDISNGNKLTSYGLEIFDNFNIYYDESSIIYVADSDMDGEPDYKFTLDVNNDGKIDIIKYGIDDPLGSGEIYWHTIIQDFQSTEVSVKQELLEEKRTKWFDINDREFAYYDFNVVKLLLIVLTLPLLVYHISRMILPDVDYWAQKSTQQQVEKEEYVKSSFYSIKVDSNHDGIPDSQINYESTTVDIYYEINEYKKTIIAAKTQNMFTYIAERSIRSFFGGTEEDGIFNEYLTEDHLNSNDFSSLNLYTQMNAGTLQATYRKFTENITTTYIDNFEQSTLTIIDFDSEGEIEEQRTYTDDFENSQIDSIESFFSELSAEHSITHFETGQQSIVSFDPEIPFSHPANISWDIATWGPDQIPVKYDSLQVIGDDYSYTTNFFENTSIIRIPNRYSIYDDYGSNYVANGGWVEFEVKGLLITPPSGQVYYTSDIDSFIEGTAQTTGHYFYVDTDLNGFYDTVYIVERSYRSTPDGIPEYNVISIGYNYDGIHDFAPYEKIDKQIHSITDFDDLARESTMFGFDWVYNFDNLKNNALLFKKLSPEEENLEQYKPKDHIFEIHKLVEKSSSNPEFSSLFYEVRHKTYSETWRHYRTQLVGDIAQQVFMTLTATALSMTVETIITVSTLGFGYFAAKAAATLTYVLVYTAMTKLFMDVKIHEAESQTRAKTFYPVSNDLKGPTSLNEKMIWDRFLQDSMAAALIGHPGGYYTTVTGGEHGDQYTGQLLVSPPNLARSAKSLGGLLELLWENFWKMGESDPDTFTALDFDNMNLNYFLLGSELPSYNHRPNYAYPSTNSLFSDYNAYALNTLGYLERKVRVISDNKFNAIRPTVI